MVNCKASMRSPRKSATQEICCYCREHVCDECFQIALQRTFMRPGELETKLRHQHACSSCVRLHPEADVLKAGPHSRRPQHLPPPRRRLFRWECTSKLCVPAEDHHVDQYSAADVGRASSRTRQTPGQVDAALEIRHRRHTLAIGLQPRSNDATKPLSKPTRAQRQLDDSALQLQSARTQAHVSALRTMKRLQQLEAQSSDLCDFTRSTAQMVMRNSVEKAMGTDGKSMSCDFRGTEPVMTMPSRSKATKHSTGDSGRAKYTNDAPLAPARRGRRASVDCSSNTAVPPFASKHIGVVDAGLALVQPRNDFAAKTVKKQVHLPQTLEGIASADRNNCYTSKKYDAPPIDCTRFTGNRRIGDRRYTMTDASIKNSKVSRHGNQDNGVGESGSREHDRLRHGNKVKLTDFHLSKLTVQEPTHRNEGPSGAAKYGSRSRREGTSMAKPVAAARAAYGSNRSKSELCDLTYLDAFKTYTL
ncbi:unnamed protein product [Hyaloperonospora brassicae]|uniref:B box-type domain-containing protein n=1 Tax=Hyaloperonospora brassicae TaxID=162125 RepID=A0AAV0T8R4_HYABA|nr:unnamed protein product [Hyaloperonospora brassicae]